MIRRRINLGFTKEWRRELRKNATPAEKAVWKKLSQRAFHGYHWSRQVGIGKHVADVYCPKAKLVLEIDGDVHNDPAVHAHDIERTRYFNKLGIKVLRFTNEQVLNDWDSVAKILLDELLKRYPDDFREQL